MLALGDWQSGYGFTGAFGDQLELGSGDDGTLVSVY